MILLNSPKPQPDSNPRPTPTDKQLFTAHFNLFPPLPKRLDINARFIQFNKTHIHFFKTDSDRHCEAQIRFFATNMDF